MSTVAWDICRSAGLTAWFFLLLTLVWGALVSGRIARTGTAKRWLLDLHPYLGAIGLSALVLHIGGAIADPWLKLRWTTVAAPWTSPWRPLGISLGVLALWVLGTVEATSVVRRRLSRQTWRRVHLTSYAGAWLMTLHGVAVGTDVRQRVVAVVALALTTAATIVLYRRVQALDATRGDTPVPAR